MEQSVLALEGLAYISDLLVRCMAREEIYTTWPTKSNNSGSVPLPDLQNFVRDRTVKLYAEILRYQILLACQLCRSTARRIGRNAFLTDGWDVIINGIRAIDQDITKGLRELDSDVLRTIYDQIATFQPQFEEMRVLLGETKKDAEASTLYPLCLTLTTYSNNLFY